MLQCLLKDYNEHNWNVWYFNLKLKVEVKIWKGCADFEKKWREGTNNNNTLYIL